MKKIVKATILWQCEICKTEYTKKSDAEKCEAKPIEKKKFKLGDLVRVKEKRTCFKSEKPYICEGVIVKIIGPEPPDFEYEVKWLGSQSERLNSHVFWYEIGYICPRCNKPKRVRYYAPEIEKVK